MQSNTKEKLIESLKNELCRYTFSNDDCTDEEYIISIIKLLDIIEPLKADIALIETRNFSKVSVEARKNNAEKKAKKASIISIPFVASILVVFTIWSIQITANKKEGFFQQVFFDNGILSFFVSGEQTEIFYKWEDIPDHVLENVHIPQMSDEYKIEKIEYSKYGSDITFIALYSSDADVKITIRNDIINPGQAIKTFYVENIAVMETENSFIIEYDGWQYVISGAYISESDVKNILRDTFLEQKK